GETCVEVARALALAVAIALEPEPEAETALGDAGASSKADASVTQDASTTDASVPDASPPIEETHTPPRPKAPEPPTKPAPDFGVLDAYGRGGISPQSTTKVWAFGGLAGRLGFRILGPWTAELEGRAGLVMTRNHYIFVPDEVIYDTPLIGASVGIATGVRFW